MDNQIVRAAQGLSSPAPYCCTQGAGKTRGPPERALAPRAREVER